MPRPGIADSLESPCIFKVLAGRYFESAVAANDWGDQYLPLPLRLRWE